MLSVIIPANNEVGYIEPCLESLLAQTHIGPVEVIVAANGCRDDTVGAARAFSSRFAEKGYGFEVLDIPQGGKPGALNRADAVARPGSSRVYLDADVVLEPALLAEIVLALDVPAPRYASGRLKVARARSWVTRRFAAVWTQLPFMAEGSVPGAGLFAVNPVGRARWEAFPPIISDDTFVRLLFTPEERIGVAAGYSWPMVEGFAGLVKVRRRQDRGVAEIAALYPDLMRNEGKAALSRAAQMRLVLSDPLGAVVYAAVLLRVKMGQGATTGWTRGR